VDSLLAFHCCQKITIVTPATEKTKNKFKDEGIAQRSAGARNIDRAKFKKSVGACWGCWTAWWLTERTDLKRTAQAIPFATASVLTIIHEVGRSRATILICSSLRGQLQGILICFVQA